MTVADYLALITSAFQGKLNFTGVITADVAVPARVQDLLQSMIPIFDVDVAGGDQLDIIGKWVGVTRDVSIPIENVFFSWEGANPFLGWDFGSWQPSNEPANVTVLPDDAYRTLIKAKIAANSWDGTTTQAYEIWDTIFTTSRILIQDNQNMTYALAIIGGAVDSLTVALVTGGYIPLKPEGVRVSAYYISVDTGPVFSWDVESEFLGGWDEASWVRELTPT